MDRRIRRGVHRDAWNRRGRGLRGRGAQTRQPKAAGARQDGTLVFQITPLKSPKVLDADVNAFASEFIKLDISKDGARLFSGDVARDTVKNLREMLDAALSPAAAAPATAKADAPRKQRVKA